MTSKHLSDYDIQQLVVDEANCDHSIIMHARTCVSCRNHAETYRLMFTLLKAQPKPVFDFDLTRAVQEKLAKKEVRPTRNTIIYLTAAIIVVPIATISYLFGESLFNIFSGVSKISLYILATASATFLAFQIFDILRKHNNQISDMELGNTNATFMAHSGHINKSTF